MLCGMLFFGFRDDLLRAIRKLKVLGNGFSVIPVGGSFLVQSVPGELTMDHTTVLQQADVCYDNNGKIRTSIINVRNNEHMFMVLN